MAFVDLLVLAVQFCEKPTELEPNSHSLLEKQYSQALYVFLGLQALTRLCFQKFFKT